MASDELLEALQERLTTAPPPDPTTALPTTPATGPAPRALTLPTGQPVPPPPGITPPNPNDLSADPTFQGIAAGGTAALAGVPNLPVVGVDPATAIANQDTVLSESARRNVAIAAEKERQEELQFTAQFPEVAELRSHPLIANKVPVVGVRDAYGIAELFNSEIQRGVIGLDDLRDERGRLPVNTGIAAVDDFINEQRNLRDSVPGDPESVNARRSILRNQVQSEFGVGLTTTGDPLTFIERSDIASGDTIAERENAFKERFPDGDIISRPDGSGKMVVLFRRTQDDPFQKLDIELVEGLEIFGDFADMSGFFTNFVLEAGFAKKALTFFRQGVRLFAANVAAESLEEVLQELDKIQEESFGDVLERAAIEGGLGVLGAVAGTGIAKIIGQGPLRSFDKRPGFLSTRSGFFRAALAAERLDIRPLSIFASVSNPIFQFMGKQAARLTSREGNYMRGLQVDTLRALRNMRSRDLDAVLRGELQGVHEAAQAQFLAAASVAPRELNDLGSRTFSAFEEYQRLSRTLVERAYSEARKLGDPEFNLSSLGPTVRQVLDRGNLNRTTVNSFGETTTFQLGPITGQISPEFRAALGRLESIVNNPIPLRDISVDDAGRAAVGTMSVTDRLRHVRSSFFHLMTPADAGRTLLNEEEQLAKHMFGLVDGVLRNPTNADPAFLTAWRAANDEASRRFDTLEDAFFLSLSRGADGAVQPPPAAVVQQYFIPGQADLRRVQLLQSVYRDAEIPFDRFRSDLAGVLVAEGRRTNLTQVLDSYEPEVLRELFTPDQRTFLRGFAGQMDLLERVGIRQVLDKQTRTIPLIDQLVVNPAVGSRAIDELADLVANNELAASTIRNAILESTVSKVTRVTDDGIFMDANLLETMIQDFRERGVTRLLQEGDLQNLGRIREVMRFIRPLLRVDSGTSLQVGSTVAGIRELSLEAMSNIIESYGVSRLSTNGLFRSVMLGGPVRNFVDSSSRSQLRFYSALALQLNQDLLAIDQDDLDDAISDIQQIAIDNGLDLSSVTPPPGQ